MENGSRTRYWRDREAPTTRATTTRSATTGKGKVLITIAFPQIYTRRPVKVKVVTVRCNGQPPLEVAAKVRTLLLALALL